MQYILDYFAALLLGSAILIISINTNDLASENHSVLNGEMLVQEMLIQTAYILEGELRNMGVGIPEKQESVLSAGASSITFLYDLDRNGIADTVSYYAGTPDELPGTQNELDRPLYRRVNHDERQVVGSVTTFALRYLTRSGEVLTTPVISTRLSEIHSVEITMEVQNPYAELRDKGSVQVGERDALYSSSLWQQTRLASQNTRR